MSRRVDLASLGVIVLSLTVSTTAVHAEVVELRNGQRIEGKLQQATSAGVFIEVGGRALTFPADQVRAIYYDQAPAVSLRSTSRTASEGVAALQAIRTKLSDGVSSKEYRALLDDLKVKTDAVRADGAVPPKVRSAVDRALGYYETAASVWDESLRRRSALIDEAVLTRLRSDRCSSLQALGSQDRGAVLQALWLCAGDAVDDAASAVK